MVWDVDGWEWSWRPASLQGATSQQQGDEEGGGPRGEAETRGPDSGRYSGGREVGGDPLGSRDLG